MSARETASLSDAAKAILAAASRACSRRGVATVDEVARSAGATDLRLVRSTLHMMGGLVWLDAQRIRFAVARRGSLLADVGQDEGRRGPRRSTPRASSAGKTSRSG